jgi:hypothetical protein
MTNNPQAPVETASSRELFKFHRDVAARLGQTQERAVTTTTTATTPVYTVTIPPNSVAQLFAHVVGIRFDAAEGAGYIRVGSFLRENTADAVVIGTVSATATHEADATWNCTITAGADGDVSVNVVGPALEVHWVAHVKLTLVSL